MSTEKHSYQENLTSMSPLLLPRHPKLKKPSAVAAVMESRQRTLVQLYRRRATIEKTIQSLEMYAETVEAIQAKVVALR